MARTMRVKIQPSNGAIQVKTSKQPSIIARTKTRLDPKTARKINQSAVHDIMTPCGSTGSYDDSTVPFADLDLSLHLDNAEISNGPINDFTPYKQGQLDQLCGLYAIINAINVASSTSIIDRNWAITMIASILPIATELAADETEGFIGMSSDELETIAKIILYGLVAMDHHYQLIDPTKYFRQSGEKHLTKRQILRRATKQCRFNPSSHQQSKSHLIPALSNQRCALIMQVRSPMVFHWTVLKASNGKRVELFDSTNMHKISIKHCRPWKVVVER